jgi:hypothetical protein
MRSIANRLARLEGVDAGPPCEGRVDYALFHFEGESVPALPANAKRCQRCGEYHIKVITICVVNTPEEAEAVRQRRSL